ncbi:MAG: glycosyl hydrolase family 28-related protein [Sphingobium limneticum]
MAVSTTDSYSGPYQANGVTVVFPFTFKAVAPDDVLVIVRSNGSDTPVDSSSYAVLLSETGGSVTFGQPPVDGEVYIVSEPSLLQAVNFATGQPFLPAVVNEVNDRAAIRDLALKRDINRGLKLPLGESGLDLPPAAVRAERALAFGPDGKPTVYIPFGNEDKADRLDVVPVNFLKFVNRTKWASILDGTLIGNLNDEWDAFRASGEKAVLMPEGICPFDLDGWSMMAEQQGMTLLGYGRTRSKIKNIKGTGIPARPLLISTGDTFTMRGVDMLHNAIEMTQPTMANNSIPMGSTVMLMGNNFLVEDCGGQDSWDNIYSAGKIDLETGVFEPGSPGDGVFNRVLTRNGGRAIQTLLGSGVPAPQPFQSGAGINILTGGRCTVNHCRDFFSSTGFALDYGSGAQSTFNFCMGYGNQRSIGEYPNLGAVPGGQAFYVGGRGIYVGCESFDGQGDSFWFDATSFDCIAVACRSRGSQKHGAVVQGYNQQIEILVEDASQAGVGQFDAILMRGGKWEGGNLYSDSYDVVVNGQTRGDKHRYGLGIEQGTYKITGEAKGNFQGTVGAINNPDSTRVLVDAKISGDEATKVIIGREVARSANNSFLDEPFGDFQGNGTLFVEDFAVPSRRIAMGIDPVNVVAILQSIWAGYSPLDLAINPSGGKVILGKGDWQFPTVINGMRLWSTAGIMYTKMSDPTGPTDGAAILGGGGSVASVSGGSAIPGLSINGTVTSTGSLTLALDNLATAQASFGIPIGPTVVGAATKYLDYLDTVTTSGYFTAGDGGGATYRKVASEPSHPGKFQSAAGTWWELVAFVANVHLFGAKGDGATDDLAAFQAAISYATATSNPVGLSNRTYRLSAGITVPGGVSIYSASFFPSNPTYGAKLLFDLGVMQCLTLGGSGASGNGLSATAKGFTVTRAAGSRPANSIGIRIERLYNVILEDVKSSGHAQNYYFKADDTRGLAAWMTRCFSADATDAHIVQDTWPELRLSQCRIGQNGSETDCQAYIRVTGGSTVNPAAGPNTLTVTNSQFNLGASKKSNQIIEFVNLTAGFVSDVVIFSFNACHFEGFLSGVKTDATVPLLSRLSFGDCTFNSAVEFLALNAATTVNSLAISNCHLAGSFTLAQTSPVHSIRLNGSRFSGAFSLTSGNSASTLEAEGCAWVGNITLAGEWAALEISGTLSPAATMTNGATGKWSVELPGVARKTWTPSISFGGAAVGVTYAKQFGVIEVIGNEVTAQFEFELSSKGSSVGNAFLTGLPIAVDGGVNGNSSNGCGGSINYAIGLASLTGGIVPRLPSGAIVDLYQWGATGVSRVTDANFTATTRIAGTIRYFR